MATLSSQTQPARQDVACAAWPTPVTAFLNQCGQADYLFPNPLSFRPDNPQSHELRKLSCHPHQTTEHFNHPHFLERPNHASLQNRPSLSQLPQQPQRPCPPIHLIRFQPCRTEKLRRTYVLRPRPVCWRRAATPAYLLQ